MSCALVPFGDEADGLSSIVHLHMGGDDLDAAAPAVFGCPEPALDRAGEPEPLAGYRVEFGDVVWRVPHGDRHEVHSAPRFLGTNRDQVPDQADSAVEHPDLRRGGEPPAQDNDVEVHVHHTPHTRGEGGFSNVGQGCDTKRA